jgi:hypothetical protein
MAVRTWVRIGGPLVAAALVAIAILPPRVPTRDSARFGLFFGTRYPAPLLPGNSQFVSDVLSAQRRRREQARNALVADSIVRVARGPHALRSKDGLVTVVYERPLGVDSARSWLDAATRELALYPEEVGPHVPVVVALISDSLRERPGRPSSNLWGVREFVDEASSLGACVVTVNVMPRYWWARSTVAHDAAGRSVSRVLGDCALLARFGPPGRGLAGVMASGPVIAWSDPLTLQFQEARRRVLRIPIVRTPQDDAWPFERAMRWAGVGCLEGHAELCLRSANLGGFGPDDLYSYRLLGPSGLMAYLLATGTPAQFAAFWRSPQPAPAALAAAYGKPAGDLVMAMMRHWYTAPARPAPWGGARNLVSGVVWLVLALAVSLAAGRRWSAEV